VEDEASFDGSESGSGRVIPRDRSSASSLALSAACAAARRAGADSSNSACLTDQVERRIW